MSIRKRNFNNKGFFGIGIERGKTEFNYWSLFRTAQVFNADMLFVIGEQYKRHPADTMNSFNDIPTFNYENFEDFNSHRPYDCRLVGVEMCEKSIPIKEYQHHKKAIYILGAEDNGLSSQAQKACSDIIQLPGEFSLNVAVAGSIVLFDRLNKTQ